MTAAKPATIDEYISGFPKPVQKILEEVRKTIRSIVPEAKEDIKYAIPTFVLHGNLVHFAAFTNHIGFYPAPTGMKAFAKDLAPYKQGKGSVQFPLDQPMPFDLIRKIVAYRLEEVTKAKGKTKQKKTVKE